MTDEIGIDGYRLLTDAKAIDDHRVSVTFDDGTTAVFDCRPYFEMGYYRPLRNPAFFRCAHVSCGALAWPNDIDIGADDVWDEFAGRLRKRKADAALSRLDAGEIPRFLARCGKAEAMGSTRFS